MITSWFWFAAFLHTWWGITLILLGTQGSDAAGGVMWDVYLSFGGATLWGWWMVIASVLAVVALRIPSRSWITFGLLIPQQAVLTIGVIGSVLNLLASVQMYDGTYFELSRTLRVAPSIWAIFVCHSIALVAHHTRIRWLFMS